MNMRRHLSKHGSHLEILNMKGRYYCGRILNIAMVMGHVPRPVAVAFAVRLHAREQLFA